jgi:hypothetical protein
MRGTVQWHHLPAAWGADNETAAIRHNAVIAVVALVAALSSWRIAVNRLLQEERAGRTINLESKLQSAERSLADAEAEMAHPTYTAGGESFRSWLARQVKRRKEIVDQLHRQIEEIKNGW